MKEVASCKDYLCASGKKHLLSILCDYFLTFILTFILFSIFYPVAATNGYGKSLTTEMDAVSVEIMEYLDDSHLRTYDSEKRTLSDVSTDTLTYVTNVVKTTAYVYDLAYPVKKEDGTYDMNHRVTLQETFINDALNYPLDNISYFYLKFKPTQQGIEQYVYNDVTYGTLEHTLEEYQYLKVMKYEQFSSIDAVFTKSDQSEYQPYKDLVSRYVVLEKELTKKFINKIVFSETLDTDSENVFTSLKNGYSNALSFAADELENKGVAYMSMSNSYYAAYNKLTLLLFLVMSLCFIFSYIALVLLARLLFKKWITIGMRVMKQDFADTKEMEAGINLLPQHIISMILYYSSIVIILLFSGLLGVLNTVLFGPVSLFAVIVFIFVLDIISIIYLFINKRHQSLSNLICRLQVKDMMEHEGPVEEVVNE